MGEKQNVRAGETHAPNPNASHTSSRVFASDSKFSGLDV
jgi:hypothetical protein